MASIEIQCPACGFAVRMGERAIALYPTGERPFYAFVCPTCGESVEKDADDRIIEILSNAGVRIIEDPKYPEVIQHPELPVLTLDDAIDFHILLAEMPVFDAEAHPQAQAASP